MQVPQRVKVFMWITAHQRHLTNVERVRRHIASSDLCGICRSGSEDMNHILRFCVKASALWRSVLGQEAACSLDSLSFDDWLHGNISGQLAELRCSIVLDSEFVERESVLDRGRRLMLECRAAFAASLRVSTVNSDYVQRWEGPQSGWVKCNVDAAGSMLVALPGRVAMLVAADQQRWEEGRLAAG
ncbi:hypothetical protein V6N13_097757 [Hibiscus sabdariffa]